MISKNSSLKPAVILAVLSLCAIMLQGQTKVVFNDLLKPEALYVDGEHVYIAEGNVIKVFSLTDGKKLYQLTQKGEGPGEFKSCPELTILPGHIVATGRGKVVFYQRDGKKLDEKKVPSDMRMFPVKGNYISDRAVLDRKRNRVVTKTSIYNADFQKIALLKTGVVESAVIARSPKQNYYMVPNGYGVISDGKNICVYDSKKGFFIEIFDHEGKIIATLNKDYPKVKVSTAYKDRRMNAQKKERSWMAQKERFNFVFPKYFPAFRRVYINDGLFYILTDTPEEEKRALVVMDFSGKILAKSMVPNQYYQYFYKGRMFYFKESEDEKWILHIRKLL